MAKEGGQNSCSEERFTITSKKCGQNLGVDPSKNDDIVGLSDKNNALTTQQWKVQKGDLWTFQNVATGGFMCPDDHHSNPEGVRTCKENPPFQWKVEAWDNVLDHYTILEKANGVSDKGVKMVEKYQPVKLLLCPGSQTCDKSFVWEIKCEIVASTSL